MKMDPGSGELSLRNNQPIRLSDAAGIVVHCVSGILWITVNCCPGDTFLRQGESYRLPNNGLALIESIGDGRLCLEKPAGKVVRHFAGIVRRLARWCGNRLLQANYSA